MLALLVLADNIAPAFAVNPIVKIIVSAAGTVAPLTKYIAAPAGEANSDVFINAKLYDALTEDWLHTVIVEITACVAAGITYTFVCVFALGLIAPNRL